MQRFRGYSMKDIQTLVRL